MKRMLALALVLGTGVTLFADEPQRRQWLVATTVPAAELFAPPAITLIDPDRRAPELEGIRDRVIARIEVVDGFAAELTESEASELRKSSLVRYVEPVYERRALELDSAPPSTLAGSQETPWGILRVRAPEVWHYGRGKRVRVGVIDTGIDYTHPDLAHAYRGGKDFVNGDDDPMDDRGHGTHVAGTIGAADDLAGVVGVAPEAELYGLKVLDSSGSGSSLNIIRAVEWAVDNDLDVINLSLGGGEHSKFENEVFEKARRSGVVAVAAAGNAWPLHTTLDYPAAYRSVVSVAALTREDSLAGFSQRAADLDLSAPGVGVDSSYSETRLLITEASGAGHFGHWMAFSPRTPVVGSLVDCGLGNRGEFPATVKGNIALIRRGGSTFAEKSANAQAAGAIGALIFNHTVAGQENGGVIIGTLGQPGNWIPTIGISRESGESMLRHGLGPVTMKETNVVGYAALQGTSMATPHVAGVFALMKGIKPWVDAETLVGIVRAAADDLGDPGPDAVFGAGAVDGFRSLQELAPELFEGTGEPDGAAPPSRRRSTSHRG
ncbi:MAG: S8 family serine peptidase [Acidobacteria bacterium]|nr:S8 family serine peptidase [Acidobacteriota bacterium]